MRIRRLLSRLLLVCVLPATGCTWLQNEFFSLDRAAPVPVAEPPAQRW